MLSPQIVTAESSNRSPVACFCGRDEIPGHSYFILELVRQELLINFSRFRRYEKRDGNSSRICTCTFVSKHATYNPFTIRTYKPIAA